MKTGNRKLAHLSQPGERFEARERFEQNAPGVVHFDLALVGEAARGEQTPLFVQVCTPNASGMPRDFYYSVSVFQGRELICTRDSSRGARASLKINCKVDSARLVEVRVTIPGSWRRYGFAGPWEPLLWVYLQAKPQQGAENV